MNRAARLSRKPTISSIEEILSGKSGSVEMSKQGSKRAKGPNGAKLAKQGNKKFNLDISSSHASLSLLNPSCSGASLNGRGFYLFSGGTFFSCRVVFLDVVSYSWTSCRTPGRRVVLLDVASYSWTSRRTPGRRIELLDVASYSRTTRRTPRRDNP